MYNVQNSNRITNIDNQNVDDLFENEENYEITKEDIDMQIRILDEVAKELDISQHDKEVLLSCIFRPERNGPYRSSPSLNFENDKQEKAFIDWLSRNSSNTRATNGDNISQASNAFENTSSMTIGYN